jgi:hypothetical protein
VTPLVVDAGPSATTGAWTVTTNAGCTWSASGAPSWMTVLSTMRTGSGTLNYSIAANTGAARSATLTVAGQSITVNQAGGGPPAPPSNLRIVVGGQ